MILIHISEPTFEYDIHSLVKAFYPKEEVKVVSEDSLDNRPDYFVVFGEEHYEFLDSKKTVIEVSESLKGSETPDKKNILKRMIYKALRKITRQDLVWGDLTGIRPTKIPCKLLEEGMDEASILEYMKKTYFISDEKGLLSIDIAKREMDILSPLHEKGYSIYIGIPFCPTTCLYCSFTSNPIAKWRNKTEAYLDALIKEIEFVGHARKGQIIDTIYIGGGTPTSLEASDLERLLEAVTTLLDCSNLLEFTVEAGRPDSITIEKLKVLKKYNVTRISVNPQTMNQKTLDLIGRRHSVEDVERAFNDARACGFDNINMDIILGLPGEGMEEVENTIQKISKLKPDSLTIHSLALKRGSRLYEHISELGYDTIVNTDETMRLATNGALSLGMKPYYLYRQKNMAGNFENTGYAMPGSYGIYNILIMEELEPIVALGAGSVSKVITKKGTLERADNVKDVALYIEKIDEMIERKKELFSLE